MSELNFGPNAMEVTPTAIPTESMECGENFRGHLGLSEARRARRALPLSFAQQQVWSYANLALRIPLCNTVLIVRRTGPIDQEVLEQTLSELLRRHESLRTTFATEDSALVQVINEHQIAELSATDLRGIPEPEREAEVRRIAEEQVRQPFDLAEGPMMRARLLQLCSDHYVLIVALHTIIADDRSKNVYARELSALYEAYSAGLPSPLPNLPMHYTDFANWQKTQFGDDVVEQQISYWHEQLAGIPAVLELPTDRPRPPAQTFRGTRESVLLPNSLRQALAKLSEREGVSLFVLLLAVFQTLLMRYTRQDDIVVGSTLPGREEVRTQGLIGPFATTVAIRTDMGGDPTFRELLGRVRDVASAAREHQNIPWERLVREVQPDRDASRHPLFQVLFSLEDFDSLPEPGWEIADLAVDTGTVKVDLQLQLHNRPDGLAAYFTYSTDLFDSVTCVRMAGHFQKLLEGIVANPDEHLSRLPLLTNAERQQILVEWNDTQTDYANNQCIHQLFEHQVGRVPDATAVVFENKHLTYRELNARANQLARYLQKLGVGPDMLVGICMERCLQMVVAILGILKAGGAYVPLDPSHPKERLQAILTDADSPVVLTLEDLAGRLPDHQSRVLCLDSNWPIIEQENGENPLTQVNPEHSAYAIFTSGSTGKPKGVLIPHKAIVNHMLWMCDAFKPQSSDRILQRTPYTFDASVWEFYLPIISGATLVIARPGGHIEPTYLTDLITREKVTIIQFVPSILRVFLEAEYVEKCSSLRLVFCGGEALTADLQALFYKRLDCELYNLYGPTECTIDSTFWKCRKQWDHPILPIGRPIANLQAYVLDRNLQPVPVCVVGELYIGGVGVGRGYLNRPELTRDRFISDPFTNEPGTRMYKTGDLARYLPTGDIEYLGRMDQQVKIHGLRIELGEIETALGEHPDILHNVVIAQETSSGERRLVAYLVLRSGGNVEIAELRSRLLQKLPDYMVPSAFVTVDTMPLTPNGKVDRRALPVPEQSNLADKETFASPRDKVEAWLVTIWESVLGVRPIGVRHNFFELGGHSLMAVRLMHRVEQVFGRNLPIATLLQAPTVEQLALILRQKEWSSPRSSLVAIQTGTKPPFFCVHGAGGAVIRFYDLARHLGPDQSVYGLQAQGLVRKDSFPTRVEDMAADYISEIRNVQPEGPYFLGGYSLGGIVALEMGQQLMAQGQPPSLIVLFDTFCPPYASGTLAEKWYVLLKLLQFPAAGTRAHVSRTAKVLARGVQRRLSDMRVPRGLKQVRRAYEEAAREYVPRVYPGRVILFRSGERPLTEFCDPHKGWSAYASQLEIHEIAGNHDDILLEPQVRSVAEQLKACLEQADAPDQVGQFTDSSSAGEARRI